MQLWSNQVILIHLYNELKSFSPDAHIQKDSNIPSYFVNQNTFSLCTHNFVGTILIKIHMYVEAYLQAATIVAPLGQAIIKRTLIFHRIKGAKQFI